MLSQCDESVRSISIETLVKLAPVPLAPRAMAITRRLADSDAEVRLSAQEALRAMTSWRIAIDSVYCVSVHACRAK